MGCLFNRNELGYGDKLILWFVSENFHLLKGMFMSLQEQVDAYTARVSAVGVELSDSFTKVGAEIESLKAQVAAIPEAESVDFSGLESAVSGAEGAAKAFDGLEPPVAVEPEVPAEPAAE